MPDLRWKRRVCEGECEWECECEWGLKEWVGLKAGGGREYGAMGEEMYVDGPSYSVVIGDKYSERCIGLTGKQVPKP